MSWPIRHGPRVHDRPPKKGSVILFVLMGLFPPWKETWTDVSQYSEWPVGYGLIFVPPNFEGAMGNCGMKIDIGRLVLQWLSLVTVMSLGLFMWPGPGKSAPPKKPDLHGGRKQ